VKTVQVIIEVDSKNAEKNLSEVNNQLNIQKKVLIDLEKELLKTESTQKSTSKTNLTAQKELTDKIKNLKNEIKLENLALKDLNQQKRKNISVINHYNEQQANSTTLIRGLDEFTGGYASSLKDVFNGFQESSKGVKFFIGSLSNMQKALIATGIGALVVTLGVIAANWDKISNAVLNATGKNQDYLKSAEKLRLEEESKLKILESQQNILLLQGYTQEQILEITQKQSKQTLKAIENELAAKKKAQAEEVGFMLALKAVADTAGLGWLANFFLGDDEEREENEKEIKAQEQEVVSLMDKIAGMQLKLNEIKKDGKQATKEMFDEFNKQDVEEDDFQKDIDRLDKLFNLEEEQKNRRIFSKEQEAKIDAAIDKKIEEDQLEFLQDAADKRAAIIEGERRNKEMNALNAANTILGINSLFEGKTEEEQKKAFKRTKDLNIASATVETFLAAQKAYTSQLIPLDPTSPVRAALAAGAAIASGLARVAQIKKQKFNGGDSGGSSLITIGGGSSGGGGNGSAGIGFNPSTPTISALPNFATTQAQNNNSGSNVRAYVIQDDINSQTALNKRINQRTKL
jgi:hypothetical protein